MIRFAFTTQLPLPVDAAWSWLTAPGALTRLSPHWAQAVVREADPLHSGSEAHLLTAVPGTRGAVRVSWTSKHYHTAGERAFVDSAVRGPVRSWTHEHIVDAAGEGSVMTDAIDVEPIPGSAGILRRALPHIFDARERRMLANLARLTELPSPRFDETRPQTIVLTGASGLIGQQLAAFLRTAGHTVRELVRRKPWNSDERWWDPMTGRLAPSILADADAVIHLAGHSIGTRMTDAAKQEIRSSRIVSTRLLVDTIQQLSPDARPRSFVCASAVGIYGTDRREPADESVPPGDGFLADVCRAWEDAAAAADDLGVRRVSVRTGLVLSSLGGLLRAQLPVYLAGAGGPLGGGSQHQPWISLDDIVAVYAHAALTDSLSGPVNAVSPGIVDQQTFARLLGAHLGRPALLPTPAFAPALLLGAEGARELALADQCAVPAALTAAGFRFVHPDLTSCFAEELGPAAGSR